MARPNLESEILDLLHQRTAAGQDRLSRQEIVDALGVPTATIGRALLRLLNRGRIEREGLTAASRYRLPAASVTASAAPARLSAAASHAISPAWSTEARSLFATLDLPLGARQPVSYQRRFVDAYVPNQTSLLPAGLADELFRAGQLQGRQPAGTYARRVLEPLLIDLSFFSSRLEGNRYSRLETQVLFEAGTADPTDGDATMLLNHKRAIEFLTDEVPLYGLTGAVVRNLHALLMQGLLHDENALGTIRERVVSISNTVYVPSQAPPLLGEMLEHIVDKAREVKNPVEAAFFLWVNIAYLQPFEDGNKRASRLGANIPLLMFNCAPLSFLDVSDEDYGRAMIGVYEQLDTSAAAELFAWTYRRSIAKYAVQVHATGVPDPFRARYREAISEIVARVVRDREAPAAVIAEFDLSAEDIARLSELVRGDLARLGVHNFARYRLTQRQIETWMAEGRPVAAA